MASRVAPGMYQVSTLEGITFEINAIGTGFLVSAALETKLLTFSPGVSLRVTPQMLNGLDSSHDLRVRVIFTQGAMANAAYTIRVFDDGLTQMDMLRIDLDPARPLPYQTPVLLTIDVM